MKDTITTVDLSLERHVHVATETASTLCHNMGMSAVAGAELALAVSEISQNVVRYAGSGRAIFSRPKNTDSLVVTIEDLGPGIKDIKQAMVKGYTTFKGSLGIGLDVAKRSVDEFEIQPKKKGTKVVLKKFLTIPDSVVEYGIVSMADESYAANGDHYLVKEYDGNKVLLAVIDGTGEGYPASVAANTVKDFLEVNYRMDLDHIVYACHELLGDLDVGRGATIALARFSEGTISYLGVGDTHAYLIDEECHSLVNNEGTIGHLQLPTLKIERQPLRPNTSLVLCSDGIKSELVSYDYEVRSAQDLATAIFRECHKPYGDATVLIATHHHGL